MAFNYATDKEKHNKLDKAAKKAQEWLQRGFSTEKVAETIWNRVGYNTTSDSKSVTIFGIVECQVTAETITKA